MSKKIISVVLVIITLLSTTLITTSAATNPNAYRSTYNDVFASTKGSGYNLVQAKASSAKTFNKNSYVYIWGYVHDLKNNLYNSYGSGKINMTLSIYKPNGSCAFTYTYTNSDCNWIRCKLDTTGTWKIQSKISGALSGTNTQTITVKDTARQSYNDVFASTKGSGYNLSQARSSSSKTFTKGTSVYVWGYVHDGKNNLFKSYGSGNINMTLSVYRPNGSLYYTYTYKNCDNNWIRFTPDQAGTWKIQSKISGALSGTNTQTITVKEIDNVEIQGDPLFNYPTVGDVYYLSAKASGVTKFSWTTSNSNVVSISSSGKMTAKSVGTATITAKASDGRSKSVKITVCSANKWKTGKFDTGYTAKGYTTIMLNKNVGDGNIRIYTYDKFGNKTSGQIHIVLRDWNGNWIREFDAKSGDSLRLGNDFSQYRVYISKKKYPDTTIGNGDNFINVGKCDSWSINCTSNCYIY